MTKNETRKVIEVMQAYVNGAEIEELVNFSTMRYVGVDEPNWDWENTTYKYRIKQKQI